MIYEKLTRQGIRDLNPCPVNGHRRLPCHPHLPGPLGIVGQHYVHYHGELHRDDDYGHRCLKCGERC